MTEELRTQILDEINRYHAKDVMKDEMIVIMTPEQKDKLENFIIPNTTDLPEIGGVKIYCTARVKYCEPKVVNISTLQDIVDESIRGMTIE